MIIKNKVRNGEISICRISRTIIVMIILMFAWIRANGEITDGLTSWWNLNEGSGTTASDSIGSNTGTITNATWTTDGIISNALSFDGMSDSVDIVDDDTLDFGVNDFSIMLWAKHSTVDAYAWFDALIAKMPDSTGFQVAMTGSSFPVGSRNKITVRIGKGTGKFIVTSTNEYNDDNWHHIAVVFDRDAYMTLYIDGVQEAQTDISGTIADLQNDGPVQIGASNSTNQSWNGLIDEVRIYNRALSPTEIVGSFNGDLSIGRLKKYIPALTHSRGDRLPLLMWEDAPETDAEMQAWIDRGISPMFKSSDSSAGLQANLPGISYFSNHGFPIIILPQGNMQIAFFPTPAGGTWPPGCNHQSPAGSEEDNALFTCPAWMYENPYLAGYQVDKTDSLCTTLQTNNIVPYAILVDFETGAYLRNAGDDEANVTLAMNEALLCPRCINRFTSWSTLEEYQDIVNDARAYAIKVGLTDVVESYFPTCRTGNFFAWPIERASVVPGEYPAYGYTGSGMSVPQPRCYTVVGYWGAQTNQALADRNVFLRYLQEYSLAGSVLNNDEIIIAWIGHTETASHAGELAGYVFPSPEIYAEIVKHCMLRGVETFAGYTTTLEDEFPSYYVGTPRKEVGPWIMLMQGLQQGYNDMLPYNSFLREAGATPLNYKIGGTFWRTASDIYSARETIEYIWSGVSTATKALIRTYSFTTSGNRVISIYGNNVSVPFSTTGQFFWVYPDGTVTPIP